MAFALLISVVVSPILFGLIGSSSDTLRMDWLRLVSLFVSMAAFLGSLAIWGLIAKGQWLGVLIDERNRISLSRFQVTLWSLIAFPTVAVALIMNVMRYSIVPDNWNIAEVSLPNGPLGVDIAWTLIQLAGISIASFLASPPLLRAKFPPPAPAREAGTESPGAVETRPEPRDARLSDLFVGEENDNAGTLDIARVQMLLLTIVLWTSYAAMIIALFAATGSTAGDDDNPALSFAVIRNLPTFDETALVLLLASHGGYLAGKVAPRLNSPRRTAALLSRIIAVQSRLDRLDFRLAVLLGDSARATAQGPELRRLTATIEDLRNEAVALETKFNQGTGDLIGEVTTLEAKASAVASTIAGIGEAPAPMVDPGAPSDALVQSVRSAMRKALGETDQFVRGAWNEADEQKLLLALKAKDPDFTLDELHPTLYRRLEEARAILSS